MKAILLILFWIIITIFFLAGTTSCISVQPTIDTDDVYFSKREMREVVRRRRFIYEPNISYMYPSWGYGYSYGYPFQWYRGQTIIIDHTQSTPNYGKRPDRESNGVSGGRSEMRPNNSPSQRHPQLRRGRN